MSRTLIVFLLFLLAQAGFAQVNKQSLEIFPLTKDFYGFVTYNEYKGQRIPANGLYVVTKNGVIMVDTPWDTTQYQPLLDSIQQRHQMKVVLAIATHFHEDRTNGLEFYQSRGIETYTTKLTDSLSIATGKKRAKNLIARDTTFTVGDKSFTTYHPGHGHTADNIVIWFGKEKVLYGGCLIKSTEDSTLGNLGDANTQAYALTVKKVIDKFRKPKFVIPGHNSWTDTKSLIHTYEMAKQLQK